MKKQDILIVVVLTALMIAWPMVYNRFFPAARVPAPQTDALPTNAAIAPDMAPIPAVPSVASNHAVIPVPPPLETPAPPQSAAPEERRTIQNDEIAVTVSTRGAGIVRIEFKAYRQSPAGDSPPVIMDFTELPALAYGDASRWNVMADYTFLPSEDAAAIQMERRGDGWKLLRTLALKNDYQIEIQDVFTNDASAAAALPEQEIFLGYLGSTKNDPREAEFFGIDALLTIGGDGVVYWGRKLPKLFAAAGKQQPDGRLPALLNKREEQPVDWLASKNKFFVQILMPAPENPAAAYRLLAQRKLVAGETENPALAPHKAELATVGGALILPAAALPPGAAITRKFTYYAGPKKYSILHRLGFKQEEVMDFGMWSPICKFLLVVLNTTYRFIPNYGVAIILLTILIRVLFWPLTHKSTESMKKMQTLQPLMAEIKNKYKNNPQKMQAEMMALYRKHKVNPMGGCLPMLVQIPVFIALFVVLRSAIELRFAPFLWIKDLSEPERLFADYLPIPLNILPIIMAVTMAWQQKLMPTADSNQQRMMLVFMPIMMLVMFYMMPSALVLYWTTNQCIMIAQQLIQKQRAAKQPPPAIAPA